MNTIDSAVLSDFQRQISQLERDNTSELIYFWKGNYADSTFHLCKSLENFLKSFPQLNSIKFQEKSIDD